MAANTNSTRNKKSKKKQENKNRVSETESSIVAQDSLQELEKTFLPIRVLYVVYLSSNVLYLVLMNDTPEQLSETSKSLLHGTLYKFFIIF